MQKNISPIKSRKLNMAIRHWLMLGCFDSTPHLKTIPSETLIYKFFFNLTVNPACHVIMYLINICRLKIRLNVLFIWMNILWIDKIAFRLSSMETAPSFGQIKIIQLNQVNFTCELVLGLMWTKQKQYKMHSHNNKWHKMRSKGIVIMLNNGLYFQTY